MSEQTEGISSDSNLKSLRTTVVVRFALMFIILGLMFFLPALTFDYWQAWVYMLILSVLTIFIVRYLKKHDPKLLERRMRIRERQKTQKLVIALSFLYHPKSEVAR